MQPVVPASSVEEVLIFGGMDPGSIEPINFELGYRLGDINVEVRAPADLHVFALGTNAYLTGDRAGETDFSIVFDVCVDENGAVVEGDFAHVTAIDPSIQSALDSQPQECDTKDHAEESIESCTAFLHGEDGLIIEAGTLVGTAGGTGLTDYRPGLDFNLLDERYPNAFVNPDRIGSDEGPGRGYRYGACLYEYFAEPTRSAYMSALAQNGELRSSDSEPCGTMSIGEAGTAAGVWIRADKAALDINENLFEVLGHLLVLGPHHVYAQTHQVVSTELDELSEFDGDENRLLQFEVAETGNVNTSFYDMSPETIYCVNTVPYGVEGLVSFYVQLGEGGASLKIERVEGDCSQTPADARSFGDAAIDFVR